MSDNNYKATIQYAGDEFFIGTTPSGYALTIDTKGDRKSAPSPLEMLLVSVAACTAVDVVSIMQKKRQEITDYKTEITGTRRDEHPRSFSRNCTFTISYMDATFPNQASRAGNRTCQTRNIAASPRLFARRRKLRRVLKLLKAKFWRIIELKNTVKLLSIALLLIFVGNFAATAKAADTPEQAAKNFYQFYLKETGEAFSDTQAEVNKKKVSAYLSKRLGQMVSVEGL